MQGIYNYIPQTNTVLQLQTSNKHCFTITYLKQTLFLGHIVLQLYCIYSLCYM